MNKKNKNGVDSPKKTSSTKKPTKKDLELIISSLEDKQLRLKAEFDNFRKRKESEISSLLKYEGKSFILDFLSVLDNLSRGIDSYKRFIYIHGTAEEGKLGTPASHGCIRMSNDDVIELFEIVKEGTPVLILKY